MRRRDLLATVGAAASAALAGCGYAYGGGDLRGREQLGGGVGFGDRLFALGGGRIAAATNGRTYDFEADGWVDGADLRVFDRTGRRQWDHFHGTRSRAVALGGDAAYLLDDAGRVVAVRGVEREAGTDEPGETVVEGAERWRAGVAAPGPPFVADGRGAYVGSGEGVAAVRGGRVRWRADGQGRVRGVELAADGPFLWTSDEVVALGPDGRERWRDDVAPTAVAVDADRAVVDRGDGTLVALALADGERLWDADVARSGSLAASDGRVYAWDRGGVAVLDAADGTASWQTRVSLDASNETRRSGTAATYKRRESLVPAPEGAYGVTVDCEAVGVGPEGVRWRRRLDVDDCRPVGGWLDGARVGLLLAGGEVRWLQRTDQAPGLL